MEIISKPNSLSADMLREAAAENAVLSASPQRVAWGLQASNAWNGGAKISNYEQLQKFRDAGLNTPGFQSYVPIEHARVEFIGRKNFHTRGMDIKFWKPDLATRGRNNTAYINSDYWVTLIPRPSEEWRITIAFGQSIARGLKVPGPEANADGIIRNRTAGWVLDHTVKPSEVVRAAAKAAVAALGYDFGSVDLIVKDNIIYILEVNKASGLDPYTCQAYIKAFQKKVVEQ